jgi:hypothetical protein
MALTIRVPKADPTLDRRAAREHAQMAAEATGHQPHELERATIRLERVDGTPSWEYVVEFPNVTR